MSSNPQDTESWRTKVHPVFIKAAEYQKRVTLLTNTNSPADQAKATSLSSEIPPELMQKAELLHDEMKAADKLRRQSSLAIYGADGLPPGTEISMEHYMLHRLCWFRFNKTLEQLKREYQAGDLKAVKQMNKLNLEFDMWRFGKVDPNRLKFKTDTDHFVLMLSGLDLGLEALTPQELAYCFDALCPCGDEHDPENLRKLRKRIDASFPLASSD
jgi:hypothetical protein